MTPEGYLKKQVKDYLKLRGWFCFHIHASLGAYRGISDLIALKDGKVIFIELKRPAGKQSPHQIKFQQDVESQGGIYILCRQIEDLIERGI